MRSCGSGCASRGSHGPDRFELGEGIVVTLVEAETDVDYDLDHVALRSPDPEAAAREWLRFGFSPTDDPRRVEVGGAFLELVEGEPGESERPLLNHLAVLVDEAAPAQHMGARGRGRGRRGEHVRRLRLGAGPRQARVRRAQGKLLAALITVLGAGMAGLVAAARLRELGADVRVHEKGDRPGGSMLLSSGVVWRYRDFEEFRRRCPGGDEALQRLVWERLDEALDWLPVAGEPYDANPLTIGRRFDPGALTDALAARSATSGTATPPPRRGRVIVATGGYPVRLARERGLLVRSNPWSEGDGIALALERGAAEAAERRVLRPGDAGPRAGAGLRPRLTALRPLRAAR